MIQKHVLTAAIFISLIMMSLGLWFGHHDAALAGSILMAGSAYVLGGDSDD